MVEILVPLEQLLLPKALVTLVTPVLSAIEKRGENGVNLKCEEER